MYIRITKQHAFLLLLFIGFFSIVEAQPTYFSTKIFPNSSTETVRAGDVNQDGDMDVIMTNGTLYWLENDGQENFTAHQVDGGGARNALLSDINGDGKMDIVATLSNSPGRIAWYENDGNQNFTKHVFENSLSFAIALFVIDLDENGTMDVIGGGSQSTGVYWYSNDGSGNFTKKTINSTFQGTYSVSAADLNNDGHVDVVASNASYDDVVWFENDGSENFTKHNLENNLQYAINLYVDYVNDDNLPDILVVGLQDKTIKLFLNNGGGSFTEKNISTDYRSPHLVYTMDYNGDNAKDIITTSATVENVITVWVNDGSENFTRQDIINGFSGRDVYPFDMDGDGDTDIIGGAGNRVDFIEACSSNIDGDMDNFPSDCDCNDGNDEIFPGATQSCNNQDNNCNGIVDSQDPNFIDEVPPTVVCDNPTVELDGNGQFTFDGSALILSSTDECSVVTMQSASPAMVDCTDVGSTVQVSVTVKDAAGNTAGCTANVTVVEGTALPGGWQSTDIGQTGMGNDYTYGSCSQAPEYSVTGSGNNTTGMTSDNVAFSSYSVCGDATITAKIESVTPDGYGGLMIRENTNAGAKQVSIFSNMTNNLRHESRSATNGIKQINSFFKPSPVWLQLKRQGDWVFTYYSSTGANFQYIHAVYVPMQSCVEIGLASFTYLPNAQTEAVFSNVAISGASGTNGAGSNVVEVPSADAKQIVNDLYVYPNPNQGQFTLEFDKVLVEDAIMSVFSPVGQLVKQQNIAAGTGRVESNLGQLPAGNYTLRIDRGVAEPIIKKIMITK